MLLLIDNYDSFAHNLARYLTLLGSDVQVVRNDAINMADVARMRPQAIIISPGPGTPLSAGCSLDVVRDFWQTIPMLGVCLGHQAIVAAFGGNVVRANVPMHGRTSFVVHDGTGIFVNVSSPFRACRYHSLVADRSSIKDPLTIAAATTDGIVMAVQHRWKPIVGMQFHPEAILTEHGFQLLANFLTLAGLPVPSALPAYSDEFRSPPTEHPTLPKSPITF